MQSSVFEMFLRSRVLHITFWIKKLFEKHLVMVIIWGIMLSAMTNQSYGTRNIYVTTLCPNCVFFRISTFLNEIHKSFKLSDNYVQKQPLEPFICKASQRIP